MLSFLCCSDDRSLLCRLSCDTILDRVSRFLALWWIRFKVSRGLLSVFVVVLSRRPFLPVQWATCLLISSPPRHAWVVCRMSVTMSKRCYQGALYLSLMSVILVLYRPPRRSKRETIVYSPRHSLRNTRVHFHHIYTSFSI